MHINLTNYESNRLYMLGFVTIVWLVSYVRSVRKRYNHLSKNKAHKLRPSVSSLININACYRHHPVQCKNLSCMNIHYAIRTEEFVFYILYTKVAKSDYVVIYFFAKTKHVHTMFVQTSLIISLHFTLHLDFGY